MKSFKDFGESVNVRPNKKGWSPSPSHSPDRLGKRHRVLDLKKGGTSEQPHVQIEGNEMVVRKTSKIDLKKQKDIRNTSKVLPSDQQGVSAGLVGNMGSTG